tara:strand:- start:53 stop:232 length:180 start_codon:yes stop_codon:yes gene_type:complete
MGLLESRFLHLFVSFGKKWSFLKRYGKLWVKGVRNGQFWSTFAGRYLRKSNKNSCLVKF